MKDFKQIIGAIAPTIATALGSPMAGFAIKALSSAMLGHENGSEDDLEEAIKAASPESLGKIKEADNSFAIRMKELDIDLERISNDDRNSARKREIESGDTWTPRIIAFMTIFAAFAVTWYVLSGQVKNLTDATVVGMIGTLIGYVFGIANQVISYYFGSSHGSKQKTDAMSNALSNRIEK
jgi:hypothetical protein